MSRAVIRLSLEGSSYDGESAGPRTRGRIRSMLERSGFTLIGTGSYECRNAQQEQLLTAIRSMLDDLGESDAAPVDHLWIYLDNPPRD